MTLIAFRIEILMVQLAAIGVFCIGLSTVLGNLLDTPGAATWGFRAMAALPTGVAELMIAVCIFALASMFERIAERIRRDIRMKRVAGEKDESTL